MDRLLIIGHGSIGKRHLSIFKKIYPTSCAAVLVRPDSLSTRSADADMFFTNIDDAILFSPEAVIVANPSPFHCSYALRFAHLKCSFLIEKPLSTNSHESLAFIKVAQSFSLNCHVAYNLRHLNSLQLFRELIQSDAIGEILTVHSSVGQYLPDWRNSTDYKTDVTAQSSLGGGVLLELSHEIDYLQWIFGPISWVSSHVFRLSQLVTDVEDFSSLTFGLNNSNAIINLQMDCFRHNKTRSCSVVGTKGTLVWNGCDCSVSFFDPLDSLWHPLVSCNESIAISYELQLKHFISSLDSPKISLSCDLNSANHTLSVIDAARISSFNLGQKEPISPPAL